MAVGLVVTGVLASGGSGEAANEEGLAPCLAILETKSYARVVNGVADVTITFDVGTSAQPTPLTATHDGNVPMLCTCEAKKVDEQLDGSVLNKRFVCAAGNAESVLVIVGRARAKKINGKIVTTATLSGVASPAVIECTAPRADTGVEGWQAPRLSSLDPGRAPSPGSGTGGPNRCIHGRRPIPRRSPCLPTSSPRSR